MDILIAFLPFSIALAACGLLKPVMYKPSNTSAQTAYPSI